MSSHFVANPRVTLNIIPRDQRVGLEDRRDLIVGQLAPALAARGSIAFAVNPSADDTISLNGTVWTFKASGAAGAQTNIGADLAATLAALVTNLNASADVQVAKCTYSADADTLYIVDDTLGTTGNAYTIAASAATASGATLAGGSAAPGTASAGLYRDVPKTAAEINELFGAASHLALVLRAYRETNPITNVDAIALADAAGTASAASITIAGTATADRTVYLSLVSASKHRYEIDIEADDTAGDVTDKIIAALAADRYLPFTAAVSGTSSGIVTFTAANKGNLGDGWLISCLDQYDRPALVPGMTISLVAWSGGATDPSLTGVFDDVDEIRYQGVVWPECYDLNTLADWLDARKNVNNNVMDGTGYTWRTDTSANLQALALETNSSEIVVMSNKANALAYWKGPHVPEAGDVLAAQFAAAVSRRFEDGISISDLVVTNEYADQFGGMALASLPYFNTPFLNVRRPLNGTGFAFEDQLELENAGVTVVGYNRQNNAVIAGQVVTTWRNDAAGNPDDTWKYLEWRHTHGVVREYFVVNCRKEFSQYRLSLGVAVPGRAIATEPMIRSFLYQLYDELADQALTVKGRDYRRMFEDRLVVTLKPAERKVEIAADVPLVSQLGVIQGVISFTMDIA